MAETEEEYETREAPQKEPVAELHEYSKEARNAMKNAYEGRVSYTDQGNLKLDDGELTLMSYIPLEPSNRDAMEQERLDAIAALEEEIVQARNVLREAHNSGLVPSILRANQAVTELEVRRTAKRSAVRELIHLDNPPTRDILLDQPYETRKLVYASTLPYQYYTEGKKGEKAKDPFEKEVVQLLLRDFPPTRFYGRYVPSEQARKAASTEAPEEAFRQTLKDGRKARIMFDTEDTINGFMSPMWPVEVTLNNTRYFTALQAYECERAKELGNDTLRAALLKTRSARMVRTLTQKITDHPADAKGLWLSIYTALYQQHPELKARLMEIGTDAIVYADARPGPSGIGISDKDMAVLDPTKWKGENAVGLAQETVRSKERESVLEEAPAGTVTESVITEEDQNAARVGAIINSRRNR